MYFDERWENLAAAAPPVKVPQPEPVPTPVQPLDPYRAAYRAAADYIETFGWTQGPLQWADGPGTCIVGALARVPLGAENWSELRRRLSHKLLTCPVAWNDTPGRTQREVVDLLRSM